MKTTSKIFLGISAILVMTVGIAATATYAWFRVYRSALVNITNATLTGEGSSLSIGYYRLSDSGLLPDSASPTETGYDVTAKTNGITDISGDGVTFYKPSWSFDTSKEIASGISQVTNTSTKTAYIRFGISFTNRGESAFDIYFQDTCSVDPYLEQVGENETTEETDARIAQQTKNNNAALTTRIALWDENHQHLLSTWQPDTYNGSLYSDYMYLAKDPTNTKTAYNVSGYELATPEESTFHVGPFKTHLSSAAQTPEVGQKLIHVAANSTVKTEFALWAEGTLTKTANEAQGGKINATIAFIAL
jgi:hypothetical protein